MNEVPFIASALLSRLREFIEGEIKMLYSRLKTHYVSGERDGTELSLVLAEINCLERLIHRLESESRKAQPIGVISGHPK